MTRGQIGLTGSEQGGAINIDADNFHSDFTFFETLTVFGQGRNITVNAREVELRNGSALISSTFGDGNAGDIHVTAADHISLVGHTPEDNSIGVFQPSGLFSNSFGDLDFGTHGASGNIVVTTPRLVMAEGGRINTTTQSSGRGGNVTLNVSDSISISGEFVIPPDFESSIFDIGNAAPGGVLTTSVGSDFCSGVCGEAGHISISTGSLFLGAGGQIDSGISNNARGGNISITATNTISLSGEMADGSPSGIFSRTFGTTPDAGTGGNIALTAGQLVTISDGATVSASSTGPGNAGNIAINAGQQFVMRNSSVKTEAAQASGGNIDIQALNLVQLAHSTISASVQGGPETSGGNITIDPNYVILQNSQIMANAVQGTGGNIAISTGLFLPDSTSIVSASSQFGVDGTVAIQTPLSQLGGKLSPLPKNSLEATTWINSRCRALAGGQASSLVLAGRETLPAEPGGWLGSSVTGLTGEPVFSAQSPSFLQIHKPLSQEDTVSLRRMTPPGFLLQAFATDRGNCTS
jgi:large exoprotein involved in heme utilization and adhesion